MNRPNILFLVWDACRTDYLKHAETFKKLASDNVVFEKSTAPARWSLPSHASIFHGSLPSSHGICNRHNHAFSQNPLVASVADEGYHTAGVSANFFASAEFDFHQEFDEFAFTLTNTDERGIDIGSATNRADDAGLSGARKYMYVLLECFQHENRLASMQNFSASALTKLEEFVELTPPIPEVDTNTAYNWESTANTSQIESIIRRSRGRERPFFVFSNYMDTHHPYLPHQRWSLWRKLRTYRKLRGLNQRLAHPFRFMEELANENVTEEELQTLRELYAEAVRCADEQLRRLVRVLKETNQYDDTLIVVTADHGENLGEIGERGERRMGHHDSVSDELLEVPLLFAHPDFDDATVSERVSLTALRDTLEHVACGGGNVREQMTDSTDDFVVVECPATQSESRKTEYPGVPDEFFKRHFHEHTAVVYYDDWKYALLTNGDEFGWLNGEQVNADRVPNQVHERAKRHLARLQEVDPAGRVGEPEAIKDNLRDLGYL